MDPEYRGPKGPFILCAVLFVLAAGIILNRAINLREHPPAVRPRVTTEVRATTPVHKIPFGGGTFGGNVIVPDLSASCPTPGSVCTPEDPPSVAPPHKKNPAHSKMPSVLPTWKGPDRVQDYSHWSCPRPYIETYDYMNRTISCVGIEDFERSYRPVIDSSGK